MKISGIALTIAFCASVVLLGTAPALAQGAAGGGAGGGVAGAGAGVTVGGAVGPGVGGGSPSASPRTGGPCGPAMINPCVPPSTVGGVMR